MNETKQPILVLITGGTIDKNYNATKQLIELSAHSHVPEMLEIGGSDDICDTQQLMLKDSQNITDADRQLIVDTCRQASQQSIVITHGTDTMVRTATAIAKEKLTKTIVLTGAMRPYPMGISDGLFNLGAAVTASQSLANGVYLVMNGRLFSWDNVIKDVLNEPHAFISLDEYHDKHPDEPAQGMS